MKITLTTNQIAFLMMILKSNSKDEATNTCAKIMQEEGIDPKQMGQYLDMMMERGPEEE